MNLKKIAATILCATMIFGAGNTEAAPSDKPAVVYNKSSGDWSVDAIYDRGVCALIVSLYDDRKIVGQLELFPNSQNKPVLIHLFSNEFARNFEGDVIQLRFKQNRTIFEIDSAVEGKEINRMFGRSEKTAGQLLISSVGDDLDKFVETGKDFRRGMMVFQNYRFIDFSMNGFSEAVDKLLPECEIALSKNSGNS